jgi:hypothetical protein
MTTVAIYHSSVPSTKNREKVDVLEYFGQGVWAAGDQRIDVRDHNIVEADVSVIQGWITQERDLRHHLDLRRRVIDHCLGTGRKVVAIDSNLFLYADPKNSHHYLRYSFNSVFPDSGIYCDQPSDPARWRAISQDLGISLRPYRRNGDHVLLLLQRNGGWSMAGTDVQDWANSVIETLQQHTDRHIVVRAHPGDRAALQYLDPRTGQCRIKWKKSVRLSNNPDLRQDLQNCWAVVNHNSSPVVAAAIEGYPVFVTDPQRSQCRDIANIDLANIENPNLAERQAWIERLAMSHWKFTELQRGQAWRHMRQWV